MDKNDIFLFSSIKKQLKKDNDLNNKIRENIIYNIIKNRIPDKWYIEMIEWMEFKTKLYDIIKLLSNGIEYTKIDIELKGGRNNNYDFQLLFIDNYNINRKYIEFKYNTDKIDKYPQFLSISANKCIKNIHYADYLIQICNLIDIDIPNKIDYLNTIYNNDYSKLEFYKKLKEKEYMIIKEKKEIVSLSIKKYLNDIVELDIDYINEIFQKKQLNKEYILYHKNKFFYDNIKKKN